jgi:hypothetical protein
MNIEIKINESTDEKELYLFGDFIASWGKLVDDLKIIVPYAINAAVEIGKRDKAREIRQALGLLGDGGILL